MNNSVMLRVTSCLALILASTGASADCYTVYNGKGALVQQTAQPPVPMGGQMRRALADKFGPGSTMVFETQTLGACEEILTETVKRSSEKSSEDVTEVLDGLVRRQQEGSGLVQYRSDGWLADVDFGK